MSKSDKELISRVPRARRDALVQELMPGGKIDRGRYRVGSIKGGPGGSCTYYLDGDRFKDYARPEHKGDLLDLIVLARGVSRDAARALLRQLADLDEPSPHEPSAKDKEKAIAPVPDDAPGPGISIGARYPGKPGYSLRKIYHYRDCQRRTLLYVCRYECSVASPDKGKPVKIVRPRTFYEKGGWQFRGLGWRLNPLFGLDLLAARPEASVLVTEGEKAAEATAALFPDFVVVSWLGGLGQLSKADFSPLRGRTVIYWPDADGPGMRSI